MELYEEAWELIGLWHYMTMLWQSIYRCVEPHEEAMGAYRYVALHDEAMGAYIYIGVWHYMLKRWEPI